MKKMLAMLAMAFAVGAAAEDVLVKEFELNLDKDRYVYAAKDQGVKNSFKDGVFTVEVVRNVTPATNPSNIQFWTVSTTPLKAGTTYRADLTVKANKAVNIQTFIMLNGAQYSSLVNRELGLKAGEPAQVSLQFTPKEEITKPYRMPCLFLGFAAPGTVFEISGAKLYEVK